MENNTKTINLNLGCGFKKIEGFVNIDYREEMQPDLLINIEDGLPYKDNSVNIVRCFDFLEHIHSNKVIFVIEEIYRVLRNNGMFEHFTPSTDGRGAFQDPMHRSFWNINSWLYYTDDLYRNLYGIKAKFEGQNKDIITDEKNKIIHTKGILFAIK